MKIEENNLEERILNDLVLQVKHNLDEKILKLFKVNFDDFLANENLSLKEKKKAILLLYDYSLYQNGYLSPDPRGEASLRTICFKFLNAKNSKEFSKLYKESSKVVAMFKNAATHPYESTKKMIEDGDRFRKEGIMF